MNNVQLASSLRHSHLLPSLPPSLPPSLLRSPLHSPPPCSRPLAAPTHTRLLPPFLLLFLLSRGRYNFNVHSKPYRCCPLLLPPHGPLPPLPFLPLASAASPSLPPSFPPSLRPASGVAGFGGLGVDGEGQGRAGGKEGGRGGEEEEEEEEDTLFFFPSVALSGLGGREGGREGGGEGGEGEAPASALCFFDVLDMPSLPSFSLLSFLLVAASSSSSSSSPTTLLGFHTPSSLPPFLPPSRLSYPSAGCVRIALERQGVKEGGREGGREGGKKARGLKEVVPFQPAHKCPISLPPSLPPSPSQLGLLFFRKTNWLAVSSSRSSSPG